MNLDELKKDCSIKQKKGIHCIIASIVIWSMVLVVQLTNLPMLTKNLLTFCCTAPLLPLSFLVSKILKIQLLALIVGQNCENYILAIMMVVIEVIFSILLFFENKKMK